MNQFLGVSGPPVSYGLEYLEFNTYAISEWEAQRDYEGELKSGHFNNWSPGVESTSVVIRVPTKELIFRVKVNGDLFSDPMVRICRWETYPNVPLGESDFFSGNSDMGWVYDADLTEHEAVRLRKSRDGAWELTISFPVVGHRYEIKWAVTDPVRTQIVDSQRRGLAHAYRNVLLSLNENERLRAGLEEWVQKTLETLKFDFGPAVKTNKEDLELAIFSYQDSERNLKLVYSYPGNHDLSKKGFAVPLSEGVVGAAFKRTRVVCYLHPSLTGRSDDVAYLYDDVDADEWSEPIWKFVVAFPLLALLDPSEFGTIEKEAGSPASTVGVVTISSTAMDSGLLRLTPYAPTPKDKNSAEVSWKTVWAFFHLVLPILRGASGQQGDTDVSPNS